MIQLELEKLRVSRNVNDGECPRTPGGCQWRARPVVVALGDGPTTCGCIVALPLTETLPPHRALPACIGNTKLRGLHEVDFLFLLIPPP